MRVLIVILVSVVTGLALGLGSVMVELGLRPDGAGRIEFGPARSGPTPPPLVKDGPPPKAAIDETEYNFVRGERNAPQRHEFIVHNVGKGPLTLAMQKKPSCKCTKAEIENTHVPPGGSTKVLLEWDTKTLGPFRQSASLYTNDPDQRSIDLVVVGEIVTSLRIEPERVVFSSLSSTKGASATARIFSFADKPLELLSHELTTNSIAQFFDVSVEKMSPDELRQEAGAKSGCLLHIAVKPGLPAGPFIQTIKIRTNLPGNPETELPIEGKVSGPIEVVSPDVEWDAERGLLKVEQVRAAEGFKTQIWLVVRDEQLHTVDLKPAMAPTAPLRVTIGKGEQQSGGVSKVPVTIEIPPGSRPVNHNGSEQGKLARILLDTGLTEPKQFQILVQFVVEQ